MLAERYTRLVPALQLLLPDAELDVLGRTVAFIRRLRAIHASTFVWSVVLSRFGTGRPAFEQARHWYRRLSGAACWPRPFQMRFKSARAVRLFELAFKAAAKPWLERARSAHPLGKRFADIVAIDSTVVQLHDELGSAFKGRRTALATMKIVLSISVFGGVPLDAAIFSGTRNDQRCFPSLNLFRAGTLLLFDKGFNAYEHLHDLSLASLNYLCPMRVDGNAFVVGARRAPKYVRQALRRNPKGVWLRELLPPNKRIGKAWDLDVYLRDSSRRTRLWIKSRLVIVRGTTRPQRPYLTNIPASDFSPAALAELYRLRWQIELVFKELKQDLNLGTLASRDKHAVQVFAWASLIALAVSRTIGTAICPPTSRVGLSGLYRASIVTRALRGAIPIVVRALSASRTRAVIWIQALLDLLSQARARDPGRQDSFQRLERFLSAPH